MPRKMVTNWGNYPRVEAEVTESADQETIKDLVAASDDLIARGNGRCYGDSSLNERIFSTLRLNKFIEFDTTNGTIECESGVLLSEVLEVIVPAGFFLPVSPGTKFITVGGAIAADVHGKNHHKDGSFSNHIVHFDLMDESGNILRCSSSENARLFWSTCGGMGLTGIILSAKFRLKAIETAFINQTSHKARNLDDVMKLFDASSDVTYSVAWIDCLAKTKKLGRSLLLLGEHTRLGALPHDLRSRHLRGSGDSKLDVPFSLPGITLNHLSVRSFNFLYYHRQLSERVESVVHYDPYFYPLDGIQNWNRLYGPAGFMQYQFVLPLANSYDGLVKVLEKVSNSGQGSPLAVLKLFGKPDPNAVMSFPMEGYTLTLDFKATPAVFRLLDELDEIVLENGGRIYLAKDARMKAEIFQRSYQNKVAAGRFSSAQSRRLGL